MLKTFADSFLNKKQEIEIFCTVTNNVKICTVTLINLMCPCRKKSNNFLQKQITEILSQV